MRVTVHSYKDIGSLFRRSPDVLQLYENLVQRVKKYSATCQSFLGPLKRLIS